jgi:dTDP-4-dehydrorhamnose reductase
MRILVTGYSGQLGYDVVQQGKALGLDMYGTSSTDLDITNEDDVNEYINRLKPDAIIHCAAYTAVDRAEDDRETCWNVNVSGTKHLVSAAKHHSVKIMYISTDYVFNGQGDVPFDEGDSPSPINYYGLTKYEGEKCVQESTDSHFIVRVSWVFGMNGNNFVKTMLKLAETRDELNVVGDQWGSPTYTVDLANLLLAMVQSGKYGTYHASNEGFCTWAEFAREIFWATEKGVTVNAIATEQYPTRAARPRNSCMSKEKLTSQGFTPLPTWQDAVARYTNQLLQAQSED